MINCPSCKLSNLGGTHCSYCKAALPEQDDDWGTGASKLDAAGLSAPTELSIPAVLSTPTLVSSPTLTVETGPPPAATTASVGSPDKPSTSSVSRREAREEAREQAREDSKASQALREYEKRKAREEAQADRRPEPAAERSPRRKLTGPFKGPAVLSAIVPGLGQVTKGHSERGFAILAIFWGIGLINWDWLLILVWAANVFDAYQTTDDPMGEGIRKSLDGAFK